MVRHWAFIHRHIGTVVTLVIMASRAVVMMVLVVVMVVMVFRFALNGLACGVLAAAMIVMIMPQRGYRIGKQIARQHHPTHYFSDTAHCRDLKKRKPHTSPTILRGRSLESNLPGSLSVRSHARQSVGRLAQPPRSGERGYKT